MGALREVWGKRSIWALLCGNGEMKLGSRLVEEQLSLDHLKEANRAERGLRLGVQTNIGFQTQAGWLSLLAEGSLLIPPPVNSTSQPG